MLLYLMYVIRLNVPQRCAWQKKMMMRMKKKKQQVEEKKKKKEEEEAALTKGSPIWATGGTDRLLTCEAMTGEGRSSVIVLN